MEPSCFGRGSTSSAEPSTAQAAQGKLLLIGFNEVTSGWELRQEAMRVLQSIPGPLCTICVCGPAGQGNSFLLNHILSKSTSVERPQGFGVSTDQCCTRGIWIWSTPIPMTGPDGRACNTILMDCAGVDAVNQDQQPSSHLFLLAALLSSIFIYNQMGAMDDIAIERMAFLCSMAKSIRDKSLPAATNGPMGIASASGQVDFSPALIWLPQGFKPSSQLGLGSVGNGQWQLGLGSIGKVMNPAQYLEKALQPVQGGEGLVAYMNQMRANVKAVFPDRNVPTLWQPAQAGLMQHLHTLGISTLRPESNNEVLGRDMDGVMCLVKSKVRPMAVDGTLVSGKAFVALSTAYVEAVIQLKGAVPQPSTAWQGAARAEMQKAFDDAAAAYRLRFTPDLGGIGSSLNEQQLYEQHQAAFHAALNAVKASAMGEPQLVGEFKAKQMEATYQKARRKLAASRERVAAEMLAAESSKLHALISGPGASVQAVEIELRRFIDEYHLKGPNGTHKYKKAAEEAAGRAATAEAKVAELQREFAHLSKANGATDTVTELAAAQQEVKDLQDQLEAKAHRVFTLEAELARLRQAQASAAGEQQQQLNKQLYKQLVAAHAESGRLHRRLGEAARLLQQAGEREASAAAASGVGGGAAAEGFSAGLSADAAAAAGARPAAELQQLLEEVCADSESQSDRRFCCPVCFKKPKDTMFDCGHKVCQGCWITIREAAGKALVEPKCPTCLRFITIGIRV